MAHSLEEFRWLELSQLAHEKRVAATFCEVNARFTSLLLKGWSLSRFYAPEHFRISTDLDLLFSPTDEAWVKDEIKKMGVPIAIDAHFGPRGLDRLSFEELYAASYEVELNGVPIRVLGDEDNLRLTSVHWLMDGGVNKEKLWDIYYLVKNRKQDFDWERCLESNGPVRKTWVMAAIATARDHLDLDVSGLPVEVQEFELPSWYQQTLEKEWRLGIYPRRVLSMVLLRPRQLFEQLRRKLPPNRIAATIDTETPIDDTSRIPAQIKSLAKKVGPFARGLGRRITYSIRGKQ